MKNVQLAKNFQYEYSCLPTTLLGYLFLLHSRLRWDIRLDFVTLYTVTNWRRAMEYYTLARAWILRSTIRHTGSFFNVGAWLKCSLLCKRSLQSFQIVYLPLSLIQVLWSEAILYDFRLEQILFLNLSFVFLIKFEAVELYVALRRWHYRTCCCSFLLSNLAGSCLALVR